jgi:hypothetical protein
MAFSLARHRSLKTAAVQATLSDLAARRQGEL